MVVGAGHAGAEAAGAAARLGCRTLLLTLDQAAVAAMPCNPAIGGPGKGHLVREIDALGGGMGLAADAAAMQVRLLNTSKGPAVQALRALTDKSRYQTAMRAWLGLRGVEVLADEAVELLVATTDSGRRITGLRTAGGRQLGARAVVLAAGVYLDASTFVGEEQRPGGPLGRPAAGALTASLRNLGLELSRFKTGTSPRIDGRTVDLARLAAEPGLPAPWLTFRHGWREGAWGDLAAALAEAGMEPGPAIGEAVCWRTATTARTHQVIAAALGRSPLYTGTIAGPGPRHCPSIEDKVVRFPDRPRHPVYLERERAGEDLLYLLGMSTSLPADVQLAMVRSLPGLAAAEIVQPGYAIEYEIVLPGQLTAGLEVKSVAGLFAAGQLCGTSGYEEAAAQGLVAGTNAARRAAGQQPVIWDRGESYIGVLVDDLVTRGVTEPYRVMTARAEHRLHLRGTNADLRLTAWGAGLGLVDAADAAAVKARRRRLGRLRALLRDTPLPADDRTNEWLAGLGSSRLREGSRLDKLFRRPEVPYGALRERLPALPELTHDDAHEVEADAKYGGYIKQQERLLARQRKLGRITLPPELDYGALPGLSAAGRRRLATVRPASIAQAARVEGVTSADVAVLIVHATRGRGIKGS